MKASDRRRPPMRDRFISRQYGDFAEKRNQKLLTKQNISDLSFSKMPGPVSATETIVSEFLFNKEIFTWLCSGEN